MKRAIVLSGGGSKGAYQIGVWKALKKLHITYELVTGTSVGAINGSLMVQKSFRKAEKLWKNLTFQTVFDSDLKEDYTTKDVIKTYSKNIFFHGGIDVKNLENILKKALKPSLFFHSKIDYGLVTYNLSIHKAIYKQKKDLNKDNLFSFIIASATCFPAFQKKVIGKEKYIDGGYSDNMPINLAIELGATEIIAVDLNCIGIKKKIKDTSIPITYISPQNTLGSFLIFDGRIAKKDIQFGYNDTMKVFQKLEGDTFTFRNNELKKNYKKYYPLFVYHLKTILQTAKDSKLDELLKNTLITKYSYNKIKEKEWNALLEQLGKNFKLDETKIYRINHFNYLLKKQLKKKTLLRAHEIEQKFQKQKIKDLLNTRWLILYLYQKIEHSNTDKQKKDLIKIAALVPKEFLKALYLYTIGG